MPTHGGPVSFTEVTVELAGGKLKVRYKGRGDSVKLTGPAVHVFDGKVQT